MQFSKTLVKDRSTILFTFFLLSLFFVSIVSHGNVNLNSGYSDNNFQVSEKKNHPKSSSSVEWLLNGNKTTSIAEKQTHQVIDSDGLGGEIIAWDHNTAINNMDIYVQRIDHHGNYLWNGSNGLQITNLTSNQQNVELVSDDQGGAFIFWNDFRNGNWDIYFNYINSSGEKQFGLNGL